MRKRILVVAHEADVVKSVPVTLRLAGHRVILAGCGLDAIKRARSLLPDLILVDAALPDMDGSTIIEFLGHLPSTATLPTLLFKPRLGAAQSQPQPGCLGASPMNSSELLQQVALALALCRPRAGQAEPEADFAGGARCEVSPYTQIQTRLADNSAPTS